MFEMSPMAWMIGPPNPAEERNRMHLVALREAKFATDNRHGRPGSALSPAARRRIALAGVGTETSADLAACCA